MKIIDVAASKNYQVMIGPDLLYNAGRETKKLNQDYQNVAIISDSNVNPLYAERVIDSFNDVGYKTHNYIFPAGESAKNQQNLFGILSWLARNSFTRTDLVVALGGGVCGDISGFAASIYLRGIDYIQLPTTFLSAIDSSVGGKTAINIPEGKNLVGSFWQPSLVICDTTTFSTLPEQDFKDGVAEAIKYGCIWDKDLFVKLSSTDWQTDSVEDVIARCIEIKAEVVAEDERDTGLRQILNFGHTIGHSLEKLSELKITHGQGVAIGMYMITLAAQQAGITQKDTAEQILKALKVYSLPYFSDYSVEEIVKAALSDKKRHGDSINLVVLKKIGEYDIITLPVDQLYDFIKGGLK